MGWMKRVSLVMICCCMLLAVGCSKGQATTEIIFTTDFVENEVFRINKTSCMLPEMLVYLLTSRGQYEHVFGSQIWSKDIGGLTLEEQVKETTLSRMAQIKAMYLLAEQYHVRLNSEETTKVREAAKLFFKSMSDEEISMTGVDEALIEQMYTEFAVANKLYDFITAEINPEISDDEARTITVKHILMKTYRLDEQGNKAEYTAEEKEAVYRQAQKVLTELKNDADFDEMAQQYNEDSETEYSFGQGTMPKEFEEAAFNLAKDQISEIVETEFGYHIIRCTSIFNREETDANKLKIVERRKNEAFDKVYAQFLDTLTSKLNEGLWDTITLESYQDLETTDFFAIYNQLFSQE